MTMIMGVEFEKYVPYTITRKVKNKQGNTYILEYNLTTMYREDVVGCEDEQLCKDKSDRETK